MLNPHADNLLNKIDMKRLIKLNHDLPNFKQVIERTLIIGYTLSTMGATCSIFTKILSVSFFVIVFCD